MIVSNIQKRFLRDCIYTYVSEIVISINPYKHISSVYDPGLSKAFDCNKSQADIDALAPHIFALARNAYKGAIGEGEVNTRAACNCKH